jgi:hypothetical protein
MQKCTEKLPTPTPLPRGDNVLLLSVALTFNLKHSTERKKERKKETPYNRKSTNGKQTNHKASNSFRKHRGEATPSPSWVLFEADEATTNSS